MTKSPVKLPNIPKDLYTPHFGWTLGLIAWGLILFFGMGWVNYWLVFADWPLYAKIPALLIGALLSGQGLHVLGNTGHEGFHFTLHHNKEVSAGLGVFFSSSSLFHWDVGFSYTHWNHHYFTNTPKDPDIRIFPRYQRGILRLLLARSHALRVYAIDTARLALNLPIQDKVVFPLAKERVALLARLNFLAVGIWLALYGSLAWFFPQYTLVTLIGAFTMGYLIVGLRPYFEHAGLGFAKLERTRTYTHPLWSLFCTNINYHMEHHLFPSVPFFNLAKVHAILKAQDIYRDNQLQVVETGFWRPLVIALVGQYPDPKSPAKATEESSRPGLQNGR